MPKEIINIEKQTLLDLINCIVVFHAILSDRVSTQPLSQEETERLRYINKVVEGAKESIY